MKRKEAPLDISPKQKGKEPPFFSEHLNHLIKNESYDPHILLGLHPKYESKGKVIRLYRPGAQEIYLEVFKQVVKAKKVHEAGLFEYDVPDETTFKDYRIYHTSALLAHDPYAFLPTFGELDQYLFAKGVHYQLHKVMGGRKTIQEGISGVKFAVWAPRAKRVSLIADFNHWDGRVNPMRSLGASGVWELFIPGITENQAYKFEILTQSGNCLIKADPYALFSELRPKTASIVTDVETFHWTDQSWIEKRSAERGMEKPISIYEVHLGSWKRTNGKMLNYKEIAQALAAYCEEMGFTHVELMPIQEHPLDESWGYQVSGFFSVTSRFGTPSDFQWFVNFLHTKKIGVILDWVPGHFPTDQFSIGRFDGTSLYEHEDPRQGFHPHWGTYIFNFGRHEVANFLITNALFWLEQMHIDGLRVDAVASMLYLDYGREKGEWIPNKFGGNENLEAIEFFKHLNSIVHQQFPGILMIAEESTSFPGITHSVESGGLGFDMKWNMGWMNDTLRFFNTDMLYRTYHHNDLTFGLLYAFSEKFALVLSHDEVVHGKKSLLSKMPGDMWQKFANLRLLLSYMMCQPGKKLLFMGGEIGQWNEWNCTGSIEWPLLIYSSHEGIRRLVKDLNHLYKKSKALYSHDFDYTGFEWVNFSDVKNSVITYLRKGEGEKLLCVHNFTPTYYEDYAISLDDFTECIEIFNSDDSKYGGTAKLTTKPLIRNTSGSNCGINIRLAPLATMIYKLI